ncbi:unnamed protein product [Cercopithifilaria johnstoni]|uniref:Ground-like domain-containing protein n=1 Tax=Cercopithifilaria johnstoni TaxID=2874296 RepID=A0A8J2MMR0_9BILA|nr:unnamed protein product [Cercopithifilaria johnstoni]
MLWNTRRDILNIASIIQLFFYLIPCFCFGSIPLWHCIPTCVQVPIIRQLELSPSLSFPPLSMSRGEDHTKQQQIQLQSQKQYILGDNHRKYYSPLGDFYQFNGVNLPQQQQQQYDEDESWQPFHHSDEPIIYIAETTPNPYDEIVDGTRLIPIQHQLLPMFNHYDDDYDISNRTTSMYLSPISTMERTFENPKDKLQPPSFNVVKRQKTYSAKNPFRRNYLARRAAFPSTVCNSRRLRKVILQAITTDVSESKRSVMEAAEYAYHGIKFDVICAEGDFSYTIHAKKYCEVTKENMTCFAFR